MTSIHRHEEFVRAVREHYAVLSRRRVREFARKIGNPRQTARARGKEAHPVLSVAIADLGAEEVYVRVNLLLDVIKSTLEEADSPISGPDLIEVFDEIAGRVTIGVQRSSDDEPSIFSDITPSIETAARNLGLWPVTEAGQKLLLDFREQVCEALEYGRVNVRRLKRQLEVPPPPSALLQLQSAARTADVEGGPGNVFENDLFISYASEDSVSLVAPLAEALRTIGVRVWYALTSLHPGDSMSKRISEGLSRSTYAVVVLSPSFMKKSWPTAELGALIALQNSDGRPRIIPVWHEVDQKAVAEYNVLLLDLYAVHSKAGLASTVSQIVAVVRPDLQETEESTLRALPDAKAAHEAEYDLAPYHLGEDGVPTDALPWQPYFVGLQPCLEIRFSEPNIVDYGVNEGKRWTISCIVTNVGVGTARAVRAFFSCLAVLEKESIKQGETAELGFICDDRAAFWAYIKPPLYILLEYEDISGVLYRQYGILRQLSTPGGAIHRFESSELGKPYRVKDRIIAPMPQSWVVPVPR